MKTLLHHQNLMLAIRLEMGWPGCKPVNNCIAFTSGRSMTTDIGLELARVAQLLGKDLIYSGWSNSREPEPTSLCVAYRELLTVDIVDDVVPYAANDDSAIVLVSTRGHETFAIDRRGALARVPGKPRNMGAGRRRAMARIKARIATLGCEVLEGNRFVPTGAPSIAPDPVAPTHAFVRFA